MENVAKNDFDFYIKFAKPLIFTLPNPKDRILASAWVTKVKDPQSGTEKLRLEYLKLLLFVLQRRKLGGIFLKLPNNAEVLEEFPRHYNLQTLAKEIMEQERKEKLEKIQKQLCAEEGDFPIFIADYSADLLEYVAAQEIPNFGVHAYYAISKEPIIEWERADKALIPKVVIMEAKGSASIPGLIEKSKEQKDPEAGETVGELQGAEEPVTPRAVRSEKKPSPVPVSPMGYLPEAASEERQPAPTWGSNLIELADQQEFDMDEEPSSFRKAFTPLGTREGTPDSMKLSDSPIPSQFGSSFDDEDVEMPTAETTIDKMLKEFADMGEQVEKFNAMLEECEKELEAEGINLEVVTDKEAGTSHQISTMVDKFQTELEQIRTKEEALKIMVEHPLEGEPPARTSKGPPSLQPQEKPKRVSGLKPPGVKFGAPTGQPLAPAKLGPAAAAMQDSAEKLSRGGIPRPQSAGAPRPTSATGAKPRGGIPKPQAGAYVAGPGGVQRPQSEGAPRPGGAGATMGGLLQPGFSGTCPALKKGAQAIGSVGAAVQRTTSEDIATLKRPKEPLTTCLPTLQATGQTKVLESGAPDSQGFIEDIDREVANIRTLYTLYKELEPNAPSGLERTPPVFSRYPQIREIGQQMNYKPEFFGLNESVNWKSGPESFQGETETSPFQDPRLRERAETGSQMIYDQFLNKEQLAAYIKTQQTQHSYRTTENQALREILERNRDIARLDDEIMGATGGTPPGSAPRPKKESLDDLFEEFATPESPFSAALRQEREIFGSPGSPQVPPPDFIDPYGLPIPITAAELLANRPPNPYITSPIAPSPQSPPRQESPQTPLPDYAPTPRPPSYRTPVSPYPETSPIPSPKTPPWEYESPEIKFPSPIKERSPPKFVYTPLEGINFETPPDLVTSSPSPRADDMWQTARNEMWQTVRPDLWQTPQDMSARDDLWQTAQSVFDTSPPPFVTTPSPRAEQEQITPPLRDLLEAHQYTSSFFDPSRPMMKNYIISGGKKRKLRRKSPGPKNLGYFPEWTEEIFTSLPDPIHIEASSFPRTQEYKTPPRPPPPPERIYSPISQEQARYIDHIMPPERAAYIKQVMAKVKDIEAHDEFPDPMHTLPRSPQLADTSAYAHDIDYLEATDMPGEIHGIDEVEAEAMMRMQPGGSPRRSPLPEIPEFYYTAEDLGISPPVPMQAPQYYSSRTTSPARPQMASPVRTPPAYGSPPTPPPYQLPIEDMLFNETLAFETPPQYLVTSPISSGRGPSGTPGRPRMVTPGSQGYESWQQGVIHAATAARRSPQVSPKGGMREISQSDYAESPLTVTPYIVKDYEGSPKQARPIRKQKRITRRHLSFSDTPIYENVNLEEDEEPLPDDLLGVAAHVSSDVKTETNILDQSHDQANLASPIRPPIVVPGWQTPPHLRTRAPASPMRVPVEAYQTRSLFDEESQLVDSSGSSQFTSLDMSSLQGDRLSGYSPPSPRGGLVQGLDRFMADHEAVPSLPGTEKEIVCITESKEEILEDVPPSPTSFRKCLESHPIECMSGRLPKVSQRPCMPPVQEQAERTTPPASREAPLVSLTPEKPPAQPRPSGILPKPKLGSQVYYEDVKRQQEEKKRQLRFTEFTDSPMGPRRGTPSPQRDMPCPSVCPGTKAPPPPIIMTQTTTVIEDEPYMDDSIPEDLKGFKWMDVLD